MSRTEPRTGEFGGREHGDLGQVVTKAESTEDLPGARPDTDTSAEFGEYPGSLVYIDLDVMVAREGNSTN